MNYTNICIHMIVYQKTTLSFNENHNRALQLLKPWEVEESSYRVKLNRDVTLQEQGNWEIR